MKLEGIHHITAITGDAPRNVDFYVRVLGLRLVKKSVNQDDPTVYHLFYADETGDPGSDITFFEYPGARRGQAGTVLVLTGTGFQTPTFANVPGSHLYHSVVALVATGQAFTARMIAAEALART